MAKKKTSLGLRIYAEFADRDGNYICVQQSGTVPCNSVRIFAANEHGSDVVYFPADNTGGPGYAAVSPHLSPAQCRRLVRALQQHLKEIERP